MLLFTDGVNDLARFLSSLKDGADSYLDILFETMKGSLEMEIAVTVKIEIVNDKFKVTASVLGQEIWSGEFTIVELIALFKKIT